jgi:hypothetical protein
VAARREVTLLAERDETLRHPARLLGLGDRGLDALVLEQRRDQVAEQRLPVGSGAAQLAMIFR